MPVWVNRSNNESVKKLLPKISSVELVTKLVKVVLHHSLCNHMVSLQVLLQVTNGNMNPF